MKAQLPKLPLLQTAPPSSLMQTVRVFELLQNESQYIPIGFCVQISDETDQGRVKVGTRSRSPLPGDRFQPTFLTLLPISVAGGKTSPDGKQQVEGHRNPAARLWGQSHQPLTARPVLTRRRPVLASVCGLRPVLKQEAVKPTET